VQNPEETSLLLEILDRHVRRLTEADKADATTFLALLPLLRCLTGEPILAACVAEYLRQIDAACDVRLRVLKHIAARTEKVFRENRAFLEEVKQFINTSDWEDMGLGSLGERLEKLSREPDETGSQARLESAIAALDHWIEIGVQHETTSGAQGTFAVARQRARRLKADVRASSSRYENIVATHPGAAVYRLQERAGSLEYAASDNALHDAVHNEHAEKLRKWVRESESFAAQRGDLNQPGVVSMQRDVATLHLALATSLLRGQSRWALVRRFAARCQSFAREDLLRELRASKKPEAVLTLAFARYLFDAGFNPLVDAAACGLRPDVLDVTAEPAVYVEAKQYQKVGARFAETLRGDLAQTMNTWDRLANRWHTPEAFLLLFRRSGRPLVLEGSEVHISWRRLYVCCVDLADAAESGSRAAEPVRVDIRSLLGDGESAA
jgi:hypothetical protein